MPLRDKAVAAARRAATWASCLLVVVCLCAGITRAADPLKYSICDVRVLYLFDKPEDIDWSTLYYLNDWYGARVDLLTVRAAGSLTLKTASVPDQQIFMHATTVGDSITNDLDTLWNRLFPDRKPDVVLFGSLGKSALSDSVTSRLLALAGDSSKVFRTLKVYQHSDSVSDGARAGAVTLNARERFARYRDRIEREVPSLFPWFRVDDARPEAVSRYQLIARETTTKGTEVDFLSGIATYRLPRLLDSLLPEGAIRTALVKRARNFEAFVNLALDNAGNKRATYVLTANKELSTLRDQCAADSRLSGLPGFSAYMTDQVSRMQQAARHEIGLRWEGRIIVRDSPEGSKLKFLASLSADGPAEIELDGIYFEPYWDTTRVALDASIHKIIPHQSYVREFLVDVDASYLEAQKPESLRFSADVVYGQLPFRVESAIPIWETPDLKIKFQPGFFIVPPVPTLNVDKVVASMNWKAVITKPAFFYGRVRIQLETPRGIYAGAYQTERSLEKGQTIETVRIPFTVSNLFELGVQNQTVSLYLGDRLIAADTGVIRIAACHVEDTVRIGFLPDSTGLLEDVLRMSGAGFQPITDRALQTADLDPYNVIVIGSGAFRNYPSLRLIKGRLEDYVRYGGSLVILGQPNDWPDGLLPVALTPLAEKVAGADVQNHIQGASILSKPYNVSDKGLLDLLTGKEPVASAIVSPAENVYVTPTGATLLSVSRLGNGQIIYCGFPVIEGISKLNIEAIHLLANLLNY